MRAWLPLYALARYHRRMRVIAGTFRSRLLVSPRGLETRPTSDRLRERLFDILAMRLPGSRFVDLYAGTGAVGIEAISREKGIDPQVVVAAVEDAIALATRKYYKTNENLRAELDKDTGAITAYVAKSVVATDDEIEDDALQISLEEAQKLNPDVEVGGEIRFPKKIDVLGRIAAQMAKQVIFQNVLEADRHTVYTDNL